jgi:hypothetical protein
MKTTNNYYGIYENDSYKFENYTITLTTIKYDRTASGKSWKSKPTLEENEIIKFKNYFNYLSSVQFFKDLGGYERVDKNYTIAGYIPVQITSISFDKTEKIIYKFKFERN